MPAETSAIVIAAGVAASLFIAAGAAPSTVDPVQAAKEAASVAQAVVQMSEERVLLVSLGGGLIGGMAALGFNLFKGTSQQVAMRFMGSVAASVMAAPYMMLHMEIPQALIPTIFVSGACGLMAHVLVPLIVEAAPQWVMVNIFRRPPKEEEKKES